MNHPANFSSRLLAYNLDITIFLMVIIPISLLVEHNSVLYPLCILFIVVYHAAFESSKWQATPGKRHGKLLVVDDNGARLTFLRASLRIILKFVSLVLLFVGFFMIYFREDRKGLHDLISGTQVVRQ